MKIKIKKLNKNAVIPSYARLGDAGLDLTATSMHYVKDKETGTRMVEYGTGLAFEIPQGYVGLIFPRSSIYKTDLTLSNSVGVLDSGFRGELKFKFRVGAYSSRKYEVGDRIGQIVIIPHPYIEFEESNELSDSERGENGYGSTGR